MTQTSIDNLIIISFWIIFWSILIFIPSSSDRARRRDQAIRRVEADTQHLQARRHLAEATAVLEEAKARRMEAETRLRLREMREATLDLTPSAPVLSLAKADTPA